MNNRPSSTRKLSTLVLAAIATALVLASTAVAEPIVTVPPTSIGGTQASGSVGNDPQADVCVGDQHSGADPANPSVVQLNNSTCSTGSGPSSGAGAPPASASQGTAGSTGATATAGTAGKSSASASVAATAAVGLRIAGVRKLMKNVGLRRSFRLLVTVRDARGFLVQGAIVSVGKVPGSRSTVAGLHAGFSNKRGVANVLVPVTKRMFGTRLFVKIAARTPKARAVALRSVSLPALR